MVVVGIDAHKRTHTAVAVDEQGKRIASKTVPATSAGNLELVRWARVASGEHRFAVEDCRHISRRLERDLLGSGESVTRVPPKLMAGMRRSARESVASPTPSTPWPWPGPPSVRTTRPPGPLSSRGPSEVRLLRGSPRGLGRRAHQI